MNTKPKSEKSIWTELEVLFTKPEAKEILKNLEHLIEEIGDPSDLVRNAKTLSDLYSAKKDGPHLKKALGYTSLATLCYIKLNRFAPAAATMDQLKKIDGSKIFFNHISKLIAQRFSSERAELKVILPDPVTQKNYGSLSTPLFSRLNAEQVSLLLSKARTEIINAQQKVFTEGDISNAFYIIAEGEIELKSIAGLKKTLKEGAFFGEVALISQKNRTATAIAHEKTTLLVFTKEALVESFIQIPTLETSILNFYFFRVFMNLAQQHPSLKKLSAEDLDTFFYSLEPKRMEAGAIMNKSARFSLVLDESIELRILKKTLHFSQGEFLTAETFKNFGSAEIISPKQADLLECPSYAFAPLCEQIPSLQTILSFTKPK